MLKVNKIFSESDKITYASDNIEITDGSIDCTFGCNPYGCPKEVISEAQKISPDNISDYPHSQIAYNAIIDYWKDYCQLDKQNIVLCDGSISGIYLINRIFSAEGAKVLGYTPQFSDYVYNAKVNGIEYVSYDMDKSNNYKFDADTFINMIRSDISLIYIDNPNNPTGQTISIEDIHRIVVKAHSMDIAVVIDEAYADFISNSESAVQFLEKYRNLIVIKTMSKGFALAGVRAGYILSDRPLAHCLSTINNPYTIGEISRKMIAEALKHKDSIDENAIEFASEKSQINNVLQGPLHMAASDMRIPIFMVYHEDSSIDLQKILAKNKIITLDGASFPHLNKNAVRIRLPRSDEFPKLLDALKQSNI